MSEQVTLQVIPIEEEDLKPVLTTFPQNMPKDLGICFLTSDNLNFEFLKKRSRVALKSKSANPADTLIGKSNPATEHSQYLIGFYDKKKGKMRLVKVGASFAMKRLPVVQEQTEITGLDPQATGLAKKEMIIQEIGTKKSKKILRQLKNKVIDENKIKSAKQLKSLMKEEVDEIKEELKEAETNEFTREWERKKRFLPDFNLSAKSAAKIYDMKSIVTERELDEIQVNNKRGLHPYVANLMDGVKWNNLSHDEQILKKKHIFYLNYLIKMKKVNRFNRPIQELANEFEMPLICANEIMNKFYTPLKQEDGEVGFMKNKVNDLKLVCFILILNLNILGYRLNLKPLMKVLRIDEDQ